MNRDELNEMTKPELIKLGLENNLNLTPAENKGSMIDAIISGKKKIPDAPMPIEGRLLTLDGSAVPEQKFKVTIHASEHERGDVFVGVNGYGINIQRNKEVILGAHYLEVLKNAVIETITHDDTGVEQPMTITRYPFTAMPV